jgi:glycine/serine hydroxymethyltransferase
VWRSRLPLDRPATSLRLVKRVLLPPPLSHAGHLTHGYYTYTKAEGIRKPVSATSIYFESLPYSVNGVSDQ